MNRPADVDRMLESWLAEGPSQLPDHVIDGIVRQLDTTHQRKHWWLPRRNNMTPSVFALGGAAVIVMAVALTLSFVNLPGPGPATLPATPDAWSRVLIETPQGTGSVASLAASPHGLLAVIQGGDRPSRGDGPTRLVVSTDGLNWTLVPEVRHPSLGDTNGFGLPSVVGTDRGFLLLQHDEVWTSENGYDWRRLASSVTDPDLGGGPDAAVAGGPGLVGVGGVRAWYSVDGSDWSLAAVPALPAEILARPDSDLAAKMTGVTAAGNDLVAWGIAEMPADNSGEHVVMPLLWASHDGRTWSSVALPEMDSITAVTGGPRGFVAAGHAGDEAAVWLSADGETWKWVAHGAFTSLRSADSDGTVKLASAASTSAGYIVVGGDGLCLFDPCPDEDAVTWTSADGRSWSRVASDDHFARASARAAISWGSRFVVGGFHDSKPAIWISNSGEEVSGANASTAPAPTIPAPTPSQPIDFTGTWEATDPPPDSSHLTMEVVELRDGSYELTILEDHASVCDGASSTMTGVAEAAEPGRIVIAQPEYACDDGSHARALSGPPLEEQLRNLSFSHDSLRDALFDSLGLEWTRAELAR